MMIPAHRFCFPSEQRFFPTDRSASDIRRVTIPSWATPYGHSTFSVVSIYPFSVPMGLAEEIENEIFEQSEMLAD